MDFEKLTSLSHGGGCGCKISPSILEKILGEIPLTPGKNLLVGPEHRDDAAVYLLNENQALIATTDFFMPIVNDPVEFGMIAAANALSDIYAMGGSPIFALSVMGMPVKKLSPETIQKILHGAVDICKQAGISIAGGHSIDSEEPIFGLAVLGLAHPDEIKRNQGAIEGDDIIIGKPLGIGILSHMIKNASLSESAYKKMISYTTRLNTPGRKFAGISEVHAMTDVTGFGLLGHLLEICKSSGVSAEIRFAEIPLISESVEYVKRENFPGAVERNWKSYSHLVEIPGEMEHWQRRLLCDPQTSGGLLLSASPTHTKEILSMFHESGFPEASVIGKMHNLNQESLVQVIQKS